MFYNTMMKERTNGWSPLGDTFRPSRAGQPLTSCEVQLTLHDFLMIKHLMHAYYNIERSTDETFVLRKPIFIEDWCVEKTPDVVLEMRDHEKKVLNTASKFIENTMTSIKKKKSSDSLKKSISGLSSIDGEMGKMPSLNVFWGSASPSNSSNSLEETQCFKCGQNLGSRGRSCVRCQTPFCQLCKKEMMHKFASKSWQCMSCPKQAPIFDTDEENSLKFTPRGFGSPHNFSRVSDKQVRDCTSATNDNFLAKGYLLKLSNHTFSLFNPKWKPHFFCLTGTLLQYWSDEKAFRAKVRCGIFNLEGATLQETDCGKYGNKNFFYFSVRNAKKTLNLCAYSANERQNWMSVITEVMDRDCVFAAT